MWLAAKHISFFIYMVIVAHTKYPCCRELYRHKRGEDRPPGAPLMAYVCEECDKVLGSMCALHTHKKMHKVTKPVSYTTDPLGSVTFLLILFHSGFCVEINESDYVIRIVIYRL